MKISLKQKKLTNGKSSLFLEFYNGYRIDKNGVKKHLRKFEYLKQYIFDDPKNIEEKRKNKEIYELAEKILSIRKSEFYQGKYKLKDNKKGNILLFDFYKTLQEERYESKGG
ncbi:hypothetical protein [Flagellimonas lutaonensis]|uniref:hypothetical protein n=1 Tax=Flagellimonas lutaonensis TaxID=516051 RepID=UPI0005F7BC95|nr:hypothetical protein [Allomuricauda lutaonensis]